MSINKEYKYFVCCVDSDLIVGGYQFKDDAIECMDEFNDECYLPQYKVYTARYLNNKGCDPFNLDNWTNPTFN